MYVEGFGAAPRLAVARITAEAFSDEDAWIWDIRETGLHCETDWVEDEVVNGLCVGV